MLSSSPKIKRGLGWGIKTIHIKSNQDSNNGIAVYSSSQPSPLKKARKSGKKND
jgi:hypothetical protein